MELTTGIAIVLGVFLKEVMPKIWPKFSSKAIPVVIFVASVAYQVVQQLQGSMPAVDIGNALQFGVVNTAMATGIYSGTKNSVQGVGLWFKKGKK